MNWILSVVEAVGLMLALRPVNALKPSFVPLANTKSQKNSRPIARSKLDTGMARDKAKRNAMERVRVAADRILNPGKYKAKAKRYRARNIEKEKARQARWRELNQEKTKDRNRLNPINRIKANAAVAKWRKSNPGKVAVISKAYRKANKEKLKKADVDYRKSNPEKVRVRDLRRLRPGYPEELLKVIAVKNMILWEMRNKTKHQTQPT